MVCEAATAGHLLPGAGLSEIRENGLPEDSNGPNLRLNHLSGRVTPKG